MKARAPRRHLAKKIRFADDEEALLLELAALVGSPNTAQLCRTAALALGAWLLERRPPAVTWPRESKWRRNLRELIDRRAARERRRRRGLVPEARA